MDRRLLWLCLMTVLGSVTSEDTQKDKKPVEPKFFIEKSTLKCANGNFDEKPLTDGLFTCCTKPDENEDNNDNCTYARVKILKAENLIQMDTPAWITVLVSDVLVTALIGWAVYTVCGQPCTRTSYQDSKASDRKSLIPNERVSNNAPGETTYQRLNTRADEYSTLHTGRKQRNPKHPISP